MEEIILKEGAKEGRRKVNEERGSKMRDKRENAKGTTDKRGEEGEKRKIN